MTDRELIERLRDAAWAGPIPCPVCDEAADTIARLEAERDAARADAELYQWLRDLKCCTFTLSRDDDHAVNYMSASDWIDERPEWFKETPAEEIEAMRRANTIWTLRVYPVTPVGFYTWHAATLDAAIRAAMQGDGR